MVRKLILIIMIVLFIGVPCGTHAAVELDADDNGAVDLNKGGTNSQTGGMVATTPVTAPSFISTFIDGFAGIFWDAPNTIIPTETYGIYPYAGRMYKIEDSVHSLMDAGGGSSVVEVADTPAGWEMIPGTLYIAQDDGELSFLLADSSEVFRYAATANTLLYPINLTVVSGTTSTVDINGTSYSDGGPYAISALIGATTMGITYDTEDTTVWSGTDAGDVTGTTPTFSVNVDAIKTLIATISSGAPSGLLAALNCYQNNGEALDTGGENVTALNITHGVGHDSVADASVLLDSTSDDYYFPCNETNGLIDLDLGSLQIWYKHNGDVDNNYIVSQATSGTPLKFYRNIGTDTLYFVINGDVAIFNTAVPFDGTWNRLVITWEHTTGTRQLYVNNTLVADSAAQPNNWTSIPIPTDNLWVGSNGGLFISDGEFQDLKIYDDVIVPATLP